MTMYAGHNRAVWNKALALAKDRLDWKEPILWYHELNWQMTTFWKRSEEMSYPSGRACRVSLWSGCNSNHGEAGTSCCLTTQGILVL